MLDCCNAVDYLVAALQGTLGLTPCHPLLAPLHAQNCKSISMRDLSRDQKSERRGLSLKCMSHAGLALQQQDSHAWQTVGCSNVLLTTRRRTARFLFGKLPVVCIVLVIKME